MNLATDLKHHPDCRVHDATFLETAPATDCSCGAVHKLMSVPQELYDREINFSISCFWDGGFDVKLGDDMNGYKAETNVDTYVEALAWLDREVRRNYPTPETASDAIELLTAIQHELELWNGKAQVLHGGHILDLADKLSTALCHPNSIVRS